MTVYQVGWPYTEYLENEEKVIQSLYEKKNTWGKKRKKTNKEKQIANNSVTSSRVGSFYLFVLFVIDCWLLF